MKTNRRIGAIAGLALLLGLVLANQWAFTRWLDTTYISWYLANGSIIGLTISIVSLAWGDLNRHLGLISAYPLDYVGSWLQLAGLPIYEIGTHLRANAAEPGTRNALDLTAAGLLALLMSVAIVVWIVVVVPLQYFIYLLCGAPGRVFASSRRRVAARFQGSQLAIRETGRGDPLGDGWWEASIASKPVALTGILAALLIALVELALA